MAIFQPFTLDPRRRLLAEDALSPGVTPINPDSPAPVRLPDLPTGPAPKPRPRILSVPGGIPGAEAPSPLPETVMPSALPLPARGAPGGMPAPGQPSPNFEPPPLSRGDQLRFAKSKHLESAPGRLKSAALGALQGFAEGIASGGGLAGGLGGLAAGAGFGGINPRGAREMDFERRVKPRMLGDFAMEDAETAARSAAAKAAAERALMETNISNINSQVQSRIAQDALNQDKFNFEQGKLIPAPPGTTFLDPKTKQPVFTATDPRQGSMTDDQASAALTSAEGTVEEISQGSLRGRQESLKGRLTSDEQRLVFGGATSNDSPQAIARAQAKWQKIQDDELNSIRRDTGERRKAKITQKRFGKKQGAAQSSAHKRNVNQLPPLR